MCVQPLLMWPGRGRRKSDDESECHIISQPHIKATTHEPAQLSECVSLQKAKRADSLKGDIIFIPHADSAHYKTRPLFHSGTQGQEDKSTLFFTLGAIWHFSSWLNKDIRLHPRSPEGKEEAKGCHWNQEAIFSIKASWSSSTLPNALTNAQSALAYFKKRKAASTGGAGKAPSHCSSKAAACVSIQHTSILSEPCNFTSTPCYKCTLCQQLWGKSARCSRVTNEIKA